MRRSFAVSVVGMFLIYGNFMLAEDTIRPQQIPARGEDYHSLILSSPPVTNLRNFNMKILYGEAKFRPWNGSYWPFYRGSIGYRYNETGWPKESKKLRDHYGYYNSNPPEQLITSGNIDSLSPAEKYDLLVGNSDWALSKRTWRRILSVANNVDLPIWFGICHGWSAGTHARTLEPLHNVSVSSADGQHSFTVFPSDIKALIAHSWALAGGQSILVGRSCAILSPEKDEFGRINDPRCLDTNPMTWHLTILNKMGRDQESFIMDTSANSEKWNYTVDSYFFRYFNPLTLKASKTWEDALLTREEYPSDPFKEHRSPDTVYILGVMMDAFFPIATEPNTFPSFAKILYNSKTLIYDLELDANYNIIGGEWRSDEHPDFLWVLPSGTNANVSQDSSLTEGWDGTSALSQQWIDAAQSASRNGRVLGTVVETLLKKSRE